MMQNTRDHEAELKYGEISVQNRAARALPLSPSDHTNNTPHPHPRTAALAGAVLAVLLL